MCEVHFYRILANRAILMRILHENRKGDYFGVFRYWQGYQEGERSPIWA
jgi:hypothetical protein